MSTGAPRRAAVTTWDWREQPDVDMLGRVVETLSAQGTVYMHKVDTGSDQYALVWTTAYLDEKAAQDLYNRYLDGGDLAEVFEVLDLD